jgi:hypothetical protein
MITVPIFDPSSLSLEEKLSLAMSKIDQYKALTNSEILEGYVNMATPNFIVDNDYQGSTISQQEALEVGAHALFETKATIYLNYFVNNDEVKSLFESIYGEKSLYPGLFNPNWSIVPFLPLESLNELQEVISYKKFNISYGLQLIANQISEANIDTFYNEGFRYFNLILTEGVTSTKLVEALQTQLALIYEVADSHKDATFLIYALNAGDIQNLPNNCKILVGKSFWKILAD